MAVLNSSDYTEIIAWSADGKSFIFLDSSSFERIVLPSIFKVAKFDSFLRKVSVLFFDVYFFMLLLFFSQKMSASHSYTDGVFQSAKHIAELVALPINTR